MIDTNGGIVIGGASKKYVKNYIDSVELNGVAVNYPKIVDGKWQVYDPVAAAYIDTGVYAQGADGVIQSIVSGDNIQIDDSDPANPVISSTANGVSIRLTETHILDLTSIKL